MKSLDQKKVVYNLTCKIMESPPKQTINCRDNFISTKHEAKVLPLICIYPHYLLKL